MPRELDGTTILQLTDVHFGVFIHKDQFTRVVDVGWLTPLVLGHNYHAIHHLWPNLPWHRYRPTFREKQASLRERGVPVETRLFGWSTHDAVRRDSVSG